MVRLTLPRRPWGMSALAAVSLLVIAMAASGAQGQATVPALKASEFDATGLREPVDLGMPWLIHAGDDPSYARPDFDDSQWTPFDPHSTLQSALKGSRPEFVWYRLRVKVDPAHTGLGLKEWNISHAFEVYANGERVMASGRVAPFAPYTSLARLLAPIPDRLLASGSLLIALRVHISANEWASGQNPGYYANNLTLGQRKTLDREIWLTVIGENALNWASRLFSFGLGVIALVFFATERRHPEYLWIAALGGLILVEAPISAVTTLHNVPGYWMLPSQLAITLFPLFWVSMLRAFVHQRVGWRWRSFLLLTGLLAALTVMQGIYYSVPLGLLFFAVVPFILLISVVVPIMLTVHLRRGNREAGILLIPVILLSLYFYIEVALDILFQIPAWRDTALRGLNLIDRFPAGPFSLSLNTLSGILSTCSLAVIMLLRSTTMIRRQAIFESELAAAQEVQQIMLPEQTGGVPGFTVESVYQPAQQVGGDFFQIIPAGAGGLLVVVGDVAGKGLPAAMLVSVLVGAIRGVAGYTSDPAEMLVKLNERLVGRAGGAIATALAAHIAADGSVAIANAGHLSPYLDGREVELPGALPLGILHHARYETRHFDLAAGSRLTLYSDGVIEAQNPQGELFGFERGRALSTQPASAIVEAAIKFGQQDDITVVTVARAAALASAA